MTKKTILMIAIVAVVGIALGVGGTIGVEKFLIKTPAAKSATPEKKDGPLVALGEFTVNLQGGFLKTSITLEGTDSKSGEILKSKDAFLKDRVISVLSNKTIEQVQTPAAREKLRQELIAKLNEVADNKIQDVLFVTFVYQ